MRASETTRTEPAGAPVLEEKCSSRSSESASRAASPAALSAPAAPEASSSTDSAAQPRGSEHAARNAPSERSAAAAGSSNASAGGCDGPSNAPSTYAAAAPEATRAATITASATARLGAGVPSPGCAGRGSSPLGASSSGLVTLPRQPAAAPSAIASDALPGAHAASEGTPGPCHTMVVCLLSPEGGEGGAAPLRKWCSSGVWQFDIYTGTRIGTSTERRMSGSSRRCGSRCGSERRRALWDLRPTWCARKCEDRVEPAAPKCCCDAPGCCGAAAPAPSANKDKKDALTKVANRGERAKTALTRKEMVEKMAKLLGIEVK